jgi:hypothetical protein
VKAIHKKTTETGRMRYLCHMSRRSRPTLEKVNYHWLFAYILYALEFVDMFWLNDWLSSVFV